MGTRASKQDVKVNHFLFNQVAYRNDRQSIAVSKLMLRKEEYDDWVNLYLEVKSMHKESLLIPESYQIETIKKFFACCECPADFELSICYQNFEHLYTEQLFKRKKTGQFYCEEDLFFILYNFLLGMKDFQVNGKKVGDIRPSQIVITNKQVLKLINLASFPWALTGMEKILDKFDNTTKFYLSPEEIDYLAKKKAANQISSHKSEAFSLGMTLLEAALLQNSEELYGLGPRTLDLQGLDRRIKTLQKKYPLFSRYLTLILKKSASQRYSAGQLWSILNIYSIQIMQKHRFKVNSPKQSTQLQKFRKKPRT